MNDSSRPAPDSLPTPEGTPPSASTPSASTPSASTPSVPVRDLEGRRVLLGVSSSIAAYRSLDLVSRLVKRGAQVQVVLTPEAAELVRPLAFETLSRRRAVVSLWERPAAYSMEHLEWTKWAEVMLVAPATANVIGKLAHGIADDALTTVALAWPGPLLVAPAMNPTMWSNPVVRENVAKLAGRGAEIVGPATGSTACGDVGEGRMAAVEDLLDRTVAALERRAKGTPKPEAPSRTSPDSSAPAAGVESSPLRGRRVLVTSGPTREFFDPVRFLSNPSSGKMGHALAGEAARRGAVVTLVRGPVAIPDPPGLAEAVPVVTAREMCDETLARAPALDLAIFAAAVSDWRPAEILPRKQKKEAGVERLDMTLVRNPDIAVASLGALPPGAVRVGFAAETHDHLENAEAKRRAKRFDLLVVNNVLGPEGAFGAEDNEAWLLADDTPPRPLARMSKEALARVVLDAVERRIEEQRADAAGADATGADAAGAETAQDAPADGREETAP